MTPGGAEEGEQTADGQVVYVVPGHIFVFAIAPEAGESCDDEARVVFEQDGRRVEVEVLEDARTEGVDEDVGLGEEGEKEGERGGVFEVKADGRFVGG